MKKILVVLLALVLAFSAVAALAEAKSEYNIGVLVWKFNDTYNSAVRLAMQNAAAEIGEELGVTINMNMVDANDVMATQIEQAPTIFAQNDFVIINLADVSAGESLTAIAADYPDTPYLFYNKQPSEETVDAVLEGTIFIGTLARQAGDMQGEILSDLYAADASIDRNGDGVLQYVVFMGEPANDEAQARSKYCVETAEACGLKVEPVVDTIVANWDTAQAQEAMNATWAAHSSEIEVVFCNNDDMAIGALQAIQAAGRKVNEDIYLVGVDALDAALNEVQAGNMTGTVLNDANAQASKAVECMEGLLAGDTYAAGEQSVYVDYVKVTPDNVADFMK